MTMKKVLIFRWLFLWIAPFFLLSSFSYASPASQLNVAQGRAFLFNDGEPNMAGIIAAKAKFQEALNVDASDQVAAVFLSVTRLIALLDDTASYTPGMPIENIRELLDILGVSQDGRDLFDWMATMPEDSGGNLILPQEMPPTGEIQRFIEAVVLKEIDAAITHLSIVSPSFSTLVTAGEMGDASGEPPGGGLRGRNALPIRTLCLQDRFADFHLLQPGCERPQRGHLEAGK